MSQDATNNLQEQLVFLKAKGFELHEEIRFHQEQSKALGQALTAIASKLGISPGDKGLDINLILERLDQLATVKAE